MKKDNSRKNNKKIGKVLKNKKQNKKSVFFL